MARLTVLRAFCLAGARQEPGAIVTVGDVVARELIALGKAARAPDEPAPPAPSPMSTETAEALAPKRAPKPKED